MSERADITTLWQLSPRIVEVASPSVALLIQDLHDTLRSDTRQPGERNLDNLDDDFIIDSGGKETLGVGLEVGITATLQNAQVAFEARTTAASIGTATAVGTTVLADTGATFATDGVLRGAVIINFDDRSITEVLTIDSENQITHRSLVNGTNNDWTAGDNYQIFNVIQCEVSGGNLVAIDDMDAELSPIFPTAFTQIILSRSSSATLSSQSTLETIITDIWQLLGLDKDNPARTRTTQITVGAITITVSGDPETDVTLTRQP